MSGTIKFQKVIQNVPTEKTPNTLYLVRRGAGFDIRVTDNTGGADFGLNVTEFEFYDSQGRTPGSPKIWRDIVQATDGV